MGNPQQQPQQPQHPQQQGPQISPRQLLASIEEEATTGWCLLTSMILMRVRLDQEGIGREGRNALLGLWHDNYVKSNVERWKQQLNLPQNRMAAMQNGGTLDDLLDRLDQVPEELNQKFGTFIRNGADRPVETVAEAVEEFKALQGAAEEENNRTYNS
jgi:hypothetical protein